MTLSLFSMRGLGRSAVAMGCFLFAGPSRSEDLPAKVTFDEHIKPIFREHCLSCHNTNDKKSGLALDYYESTMAGGSGGELVVAGDLESSRLWALTSHYEQPKMPPNQDRIPDAKLQLIKRWIEQGMPENNGSEIMKPKVDLSAMGEVSQTRPDGAPPMPESTFKQTPLYTPRAAAISALAASPWSTMFAVGGQEQIVLYHSQTGDLLGILPFPEGEPQSITFSRDGRMMLVGGGRHAHSGFAVLYEVKTGKRITRVGDELDIVMAADLSEDNSKIALGGPQKMLRVYDTESGKLLHEVKKHTDWIHAVRFSPDGLLVASADRSNGLLVWEAESGKLFLDLIGHKGDIRSVAWRPDSMALVSGSLDGTLKLWDMNEGKLIKSWDAHGGGVLSVAICNDGTIASTGQDKKVKLWDTAGNPLLELGTLPEVGMEVAVSVDSKNVAAGDWQGNVKVWERANPKKEFSLRANPKTLEQAVADSEKSLANLFAARTIDEKNWTVFEAKIAAANAVVTENEKRLANSANELKSNQNEMQLVQKDAEATEARLKESLLKIDSSRKQLQEKFNALAVLKSKGQTIGAMDDEITAIKKSVEEQEKSIAGIRQLVLEKNSAVAVAQSQTGDLTTTQTKLQKELTAAVTIVKAIEQEASPVKAKNEKSIVQVNSQQAKVDHLRKDLELFNRSMQEWSARQSEIQKEVSQLEQQRQASLSGYEAEETNRKGTIDKIEAIKKQIEQLRQSLAQLEKQKTRSDHTMAQKQSVIETVGGQLGQLQTEQRSLVELLESYDTSR